jgi:DNA-binding HxlR family transcriptional regulator
VNSYDHYDPVARALDVVGERWTLLVVRDLVIGPKRYRDLLEGLPGIAPQLLTARLRTLEAAGFVRRRALAGTGRTKIYELTKRGRALARVVFALGRIGLELLGPAEVTDDVQAEPLALALPLTFHGGNDLAETCALEIGDQVFAVDVAGGAVEVASGRPDNASMTLTTDARTLLGLLTGQLGIEAALASDRVRSRAPRPALERFIAAFAFPPATAAAA